VFDGMSAEQVAALGAVTGQVLDRLGRGQPTGHRG
jgi:hypothetical protein